MPRLLQAGGGGGGGIGQLVYSVAGVLTVAIDQAFPVRPSKAGALTEIRGEVRVASTGADLILTIKKNGAPIATVTIPAGSKFVTQTTISDVDFVKDDFYTVDIDQIGSTIAGSDLIVSLRGS